MVGVEVGPSEPPGPEGFELVHPAMKANGNSAVRIKPITNFFTFASPEKFF
jgi:hypothetical protein